LRGPLTPSWHERITPLRVVGILIGAVLLTAIILTRIQSGYYLFTPDGAHPVGPIVNVAGAKPAKGGGALYFVDVREVPASDFDMLFRSWLYPHSSKIKTSQLLAPGTNSAQYNQGTLREMATSKQIAAAVAERQVGLPVVARDNGVLVDDVYGGIPAAAKVFPADLIIAANGKSTIQLPALEAVDKTLKPGDIIHLTIVRGGRTVHEDVKTIADPQDPSHALIGIVPEQGVRTIKLPVKVKINSGGIGGPSAGLAFTLEVMRKLGADVTHGYRVAATGQMTIDGTVFPIGGVEQKTYGVRDAGAQVFLVPAAGGNAKEAEKYAGPKLKIIPVTSLNQALRALAKLPKLK
jgi:PDZ domain-containing protein